MGQGQLRLKCAHCYKPFGKHEWAGGVEHLALLCEQSVSQHDSSCRTPIRQPLRGTA